MTTPLAPTSLSPSLNMSAWDSGGMAGSLKMSGNKAQDDAKLKKTCQELESVFLNMLLKSMRDTVPKSKIGGNTQQTETMQSMLDMEMTRNMAAAGGTGIADMLYRNLTHPGVATLPVQSVKK